MKIFKIQTSEINIPIIKPFNTSIRTVDSINNIIVKIITDNGLVGYGEAAPHPFVTGETKDSIKATLEHIGNKITGMNLENFEGIMIEIHNRILNNTSAKSAIDMAIFDLYAQYLDKPLYTILGGYRRQIETDISISLNPITEMVNDSLDATNRGFNTLKIKLGQEYKQDISRISEIRKAVGKNIKLRVDANQGWKPKEAIKIISEMEDMGLDIELVEQPVHYKDIDGMAFVTKNVKTPILADESVHSPSDVLNIIQKKAADLINIKLIKTGGIYNALKICSIAESIGIECMIGCTNESKLSISAAAHLACAKRVITKFDLDSHLFCADDSLLGGPLTNESKIIMTEASGIGFRDLF
ncbi:dipeptide epimerase [Abyssisolibacter fermentans]|uniref:dipeptide epimerase n=1 Tax=Abyssisolibacter fermentans TaxID=1766203 RepID=UPI00083775E7|nr:dipeptide epimerase [Abyssisolibacter fermentans]